MNRFLFFLSPTEKAETPVAEKQKMPAGHNPKFKFWFLFLLVKVAIVGSLITFMARGPKKDYVEYIDGKPRIAPWRLEKLERELKDIDDSEQYALLAVEDGLYPCYSCEQKASIFLKKDEVWKYGYTRLREKNRYGQWAVKNKLRYLVEFRGTLGACAKEEKTKIYSYPVLPENLRRAKPLKRPPGNKKD